MNLNDINILQMEITSYCNAKCPHCGRFDIDGNLHPELKLSHLDLSTIISNLHFQNLKNLKRVIIEGDKGDPVMHPNVIDLIIAAATSPGEPVINLVTNGSIRSEKWWADLANMKIPKLFVTFSIDGLEDTNHLYRVGLEYKKIINNAKAFINAGGMAIWKFIKFAHNEHQIDIAQQLSKNLGFIQFRYVPCDEGRFLGEKTWKIIEDNQTKYTISPPFNKTSGRINNIDVKNYVTVNTKITNKICPNLQHGQIYINYQGYVIPCCMMHFDTLNTYIGKDQLVELTGGLENNNLNKLKLEQILENQFFKYSLEDSLKSGNWQFNCERSCREQITINLKNAS